MKRIFVFLLVIFMPNIVFGLSDSCTKPSKFTIDKRCYVTEDDKLTSPYNAIVSIRPPGCTGTIIKYNDKLYVFTAKHCTDNDDDGSPDNTLQVNLQNGSYFGVRYKASGNYRIIPDENYDGDWAVYEFPDSYDAGSLFTEISDKKGRKIKSDTYMARDIGYGALKIMSDSDIRYFKDKYIDFLKTNEKKEVKGTEYDYGFDKGGIWGVGFNPDYTTEHVLGFLNFCWDEDIDYYNYLFQNGIYLKKSECGYDQDGARKACQGWGGNSGGGIFDSVNKLMAIHTRGNSNIGGIEHAGKDDSFCAVCQIDLLNNSSYGALSKIKAALR